MKHTKKPPLWYNPIRKDARRAMGEDDLIHMAADREGQALLASYCRMYRSRAEGQTRD